ncbi:MAG: GNAT family N-acetyltransferase [Myxococcales bacterium]|nr:GNAT family N-acetyltransferase [Myxococcales bacterium]
MSGEQGHASDQVVDGVTLRAAVVQDARALLHFKRIVLRETEFLLQGPEDLSDQLSDESALIDSFGRHSGCLLLLAWEGQQIVGMCTVVAGGLARSRHVGQTGMAVRRSHWRRGIASALLAEVRRWSLVQGGLHKLSLQVHAANLPARRLYERHGFDYEGTLRDEAVVAGQYADLLAMGHILS